jgi:hypothetical protein
MTVLKPALPDVAGRQNDGRRYLRMQDVRLEMPANGCRPLGSCIPRSGLSRSDFVPWHIAAVTASEN